MSTPDQDSTDDSPVAEESPVVDEASDTDGAPRADEVPAPAAEKPVVARVAGDKPVQTVGRRKEAVVRVRLVPGSGNFRLNGRDLASYFPNKLHQQLVKDPFTTIEKVDAFDVFASLHGGGISGQAGALRLAIARALIQFNADDRPALKAAGFLTRDARATERKKYGLKKARKAPQYSKR
ncbi:MAG: 30S ribosomal protein S9 [Pseudonocardia sp.]